MKRLVLHNYNVLMIIFLLFIYSYGHLNNNIAITLVKNPLNTGSMESDSITLNHTIKFYIDLNNDIDNESSHMNRMKKNYFSNTTRYVEFKCTNYLVGINCEGIVEIKDSESRVAQVLRHINDDVGKGEVIDWKFSLNYDQLYFKVDEPAIVYVNDFFFFCFVIKLSDDKQAVAQPAKISEKEAPHADLVVFKSDGSKDFTESFKMEKLENPSKPRNCRENCFWWSENVEEPFFKPDMPFGLAMDFKKVDSSYWFIKAKLQSKNIEKSLTFKVSKHSNLIWSVNENVYLFFYHDYLASIMEKASNTELQLFYNGSHAIPISNK